MQKRPGGPQPDPTQGACPQSTMGPRVCPPGGTSGCQSGAGSTPVPRTPACHSHQPTHLCCPCPGPTPSSCPQSLLCTLILSDASGAPGPRTLVATGLCGSDSDGCRCPARMGPHGVHPVESCPQPSVSAPSVWGQPFLNQFYEEIFNPFGVYFGIGFEVRVCRVYTDGLLLLM